MEGTIPAVSSSRAEPVINHSHSIIRPLRKAGPQPSMAGTLLEQLTVLTHGLPLPGQEGIIFLPLGLIFPDKNQTLPTLYTLRM